MKPDDMEWSDWSDFIFDYVETDACVSAIVFLTLTRYNSIWINEAFYKLSVKNNYPVPETSKDQEKLLKTVTDADAISWDEIMDIELEELKYQCSQTDIDYEFVIDSSGSIGEQIAQYNYAQYKMRHNFLPI